MIATLEIACPSEILLGLREEPRHFARVVQELAAIALFRDGKLSSGMAAAWLGVSRVEFLLLAMREGCELLSDTPADFARETTPL
jgi:predicted HTH domain antitoxin